MKLGNISARAATDNSELRDELKETFKNFSSFSEKDNLLYDTNGQVTNTILKKNKELLFLEKQLWDYVEILAKSNDEESRATLKQVFNFSEDLIDILTSLQDQEAFSRLIEENNFLSFQIPYYLQDKIYANQNGASGMSLVIDRFIPIFINALKESVRGIGEMQLGFSSQFGMMLRTRKLNDLFNIMSAYPMQFCLRCEEITIANILVEENPDRLEKLKELKRTQIISTCRHNMDILKKMTA